MSYAANLINDELDETVRKVRQKRGLEKNSTYYERLKINDNLKPPPKVFFSGRRGRRE